MCVRSNGVRGDAERSFEFGSSNQRNKGALHSQQWPVGGAVRVRLVPGTREPRGRLFYRVAVYKPSPTPACHVSSAEGAAPGAVQGG